MILAATAMSKAFYFIKQATTDFSDDDCMSSGAAMAYYTVFSLPPLLVMVVLIASWFGVSQATIDGLVQKQIGLPVGMAAAGGDGASDRDTSGGPNDGGLHADQLAEKTLAGSWWKQIISIALLVFSATGLFAQLQYTLNRAWEVKPDPAQGGIKSFVVKRVLSLGMVIVVAFLLLVSLVVTSMLEYIVEMVTGGGDTAAAMGLGMLLNVAASFAAATVLFAAIYKVLPDAEIAFRDVWIGAAMTAGLFVGGKALLGWYLSSADIGSGWGNAAGSLIAVLVWVYYNSLIVLFGAELTQVWATTYGHGIEPSAGAVKSDALKHREPPLDQLHPVTPRTSGFWTFGSRS